MTWTDLTALISAMVAVVTAVATSLVMASKIGKMAGVWDTTLKNQNVIIEELKTEVKALATVITNQAVQSNRQDTMAAQLSRLEHKVDELAHGEGFVFPLGTHMPSK